jgi:hypothetical protein
MSRVFRPRRYANVVSTLALVVALGGTSYAAVELPKNSVGSKQLKTNAVTSSKVKDRTLRSKDFKAGELPAGARGLAGAPGAPGPKGDTGTPGTQGVAGPPGVSGWQRIQNTVVVPAYEVTTESTPCPVGKKVLGGAVENPSSLTLMNSYPNSDTSWSVKVYNEGPFNRNVTVHVICGVVQ